VAAVVLAPLRALAVPVAAAQVPTSEAAPLEPLTPAAEAAES